VLAGAGTGKTTVVVERVRHLLQRDATLRPENILVLTYNVKAAAELTQRVEQLLGLEVASRLWIHNFHSFGHRLLSDHRADLDLADRSDVLDQVGQRLLLRELRPKLAHFVYHRVGFRPAALNRFADVISRAKDELVTPEEYTAYANAQHEAFTFKHGAGVFEQVVEDLRRRDAEAKLWQVNVVRRELTNGYDQAEKIAGREARRDAVGGGYPTWWTQLTEEQDRIARGLQQTYLRDAEALDVLRLLEEAEAYTVYQRALRDKGQLDFGEQQLRTIQLLMERPNILLRYQTQFRHVLVDEFQDANMAQILLLELVGRGPDKPDNVVVVGDDDQSIYRFRGASYAAFERFRERFETPPAWALDRPPIKVASQPLLENRRSTANVLTAAVRLIEHNDKRLKSDPLRAIKELGTPVDLVYATDEADEADYIVSWMQRVHDEPAQAQPRRWSDIAVLYRKHRHRDAIVDRLRKQAIPYVVVGASGLFSVPDVRDVESALRVAANSTDSVAFTRLLTAAPWRLDAPEIARLTRAADWDASPIYETAAQVLRAGEIYSYATDGLDSPDPTADQALPTPWADTDLPAQTDEEPESVRERRTREQRSKWRKERLEVGLRVKLRALFDVLDPLVGRAQRDGPFAILEEYLVRTNLLHDLIAVETPGAQRTLLALARFMRFVADWQQAHPRDSLADFIAYLDIYQEAGGDLDTDVVGRVDVEGVQLMTIYQAKGLEWDAVVVPRLVETQFPDTREESQLIPVELLKQRPPADFAIDEERRLLYVAMTRAKRRLLLSAIDTPGGKNPVSRFVAEVAPVDENGWLPSDVEVERQAPAIEAEVEAPTTQLLKLMPVPMAQERRFALRRRAVELIGLLEGLAADQHAERGQLTAELVTVAEESAGIATEARSNGIDPLTLTVLGRHAPAGKTLLELAPLPGSYSHSALNVYRECPLRYAFERVYRIPVDDRKSYFEFGSTIHTAFESYARARRDAVAAGAPVPGYEVLKGAFDQAWQPRNYADIHAAEHYEKRAEPALRRFYDRELSRPGQQIGFEVGFGLELDDPETGTIRLYGVLDRIDRLSNGSIEITDYKTGRPRSQADVDRDEQLSTYALAMTMGAVRDPQTGEILPAASKLTLYFTETDQALSTTRSPEQLAEFRARLVETVRHIRSGDFTATPEQWKCGNCDYRLICPSRWGAEATV
jgi:superfamily I DNA/RNA helicase/RecB family exonuclease